MAIAKAYAARLPSHPLSPFFFERREPRHDDVVIDIHYCGICHGDVAMVDNAFGFSLYPMVPGHEITGIVREVGAGVKRFRPGDRVGVGSFVDSCVFCTQRDETLEHIKPGLISTYNSFEADGMTMTYGGYSDSIVVRQGYVLNIPDALPLDRAAPLLCIGTTILSALRKTDAIPNRHIGIIGHGALARLCNDMARALAISARILNEVDAATHSSEAFDLVIDTISIDRSHRQYMRLLKTGGELLPLHAPSIARSHEQPSVLARMASIRATQEMLLFCEKNGISTDIERIDTHHLNDAFCRLRQNDLERHFVFDATSLAMT